MLTCNVPYRTPIQEDALARIFRDLTPPGRWAGHVATFFADSPIGEIRRFLDRNGVTKEEARRYYETHVRGIHPRPELEATL